MAKQKYEKKLIPQRLEVKLVGTVQYDDITNQFFIKVEKDEKVEEYYLNEILELSLDREISITVDNIREVSEDAVDEDEDEE